MSTLTPETPPEQSVPQDEVQYWGNVHRIIKNLRAMHLSMDMPVTADDTEAVHEETGLNDQLSVVLKRFDLPQAPLYGKAWQVDRTIGYADRQAVAYIPKVRHWRTGQVLVPEDGKNDHLRRATFEETSIVLGVTSLIGQEQGSFTSEVLRHLARSKN